MNIFSNRNQNAVMNFLEQDLHITAGLREAEGQRGDSSMLELVFASYANIHKVTSTHSQWEGHNERKNSEESLIAILISHIKYCENNSTHKLSPNNTICIFIKLGIIIFLKVVTTNQNTFSLLNIQCHLNFV